MLNVFLLKKVEAEILLQLKTIYKFVVCLESIIIEKDFCYDKWILRMCVGGLVLVEKRVV